MLFRKKGCHGISYNDVVDTLALGCKALYLPQVLPFHLTVRYIYQMQLTSHTKKMDGKTQIGYSDDMYIFYIQHGHKGACLIMFMQYEFLNVI